MEKINYRQVVHIKEINRHSVTTELHGQVFVKGEWVTVENNSKPFTLGAGDDLRVDNLEAIITFTTKE